MNIECKQYRQLGKNWLLGLLSALIVVSCTSSIREISQKRFMHMVEEQEVERVTIVNDQTVEVRLTPNALANTKYQGLLGNKKQLENEKPHFRLMIISDKAFRDDLAKMNPTFPITTEKRSFF